MEKVSINTVLPLFVLVLITMTTFPLNSVVVFASSHCSPMITDVLQLCQPYFLNPNSIQISTSSSCCSTVKSLVATDSGCICDIQMEIQNYPMLNNNVTKMIKLPALCGVSLPCDLNNVNVAPSPADVPESHGLEYLTANSAQSPSQSNSTSPNSKPQSHSSPNSPASVTVVVSDDHLIESWIFMLLIIIIMFLELYDLCNTLRAA